MYYNQMPEMARQASNLFRKHLSTFLICGAFISTIRTLPPLLVFLLGIPEEAVRSSIITVVLLGVSFWILAWVLKAPLLNMIFMMWDDKPVSWHTFFSFGEHIHFAWRLLLAAIQNFMYFILFSILLLLITTSALLLIARPLLEVLLANLPNIYKIFTQIPSQFKMAFAKSLVTGLTTDLVQDPQRLLLAFILSLLLITAALWFYIISQYAFINYLYTPSVSYYQSFKNAIEASKGIKIKMVLYQLLALLYFWWAIIPLILLSFVPCMGIGEIGMFCITNFIVIGLYKKISK